MKKRLMLALTMLLCVLLLCSCGEEKKYDIKTSGSQGTTQQNPGAAQNHSNNAQSAGEENYDPLAEEDDYTGDEDYWGEIEIPVPQAATATPAPTMRSQYAGATPVVIDPIDKPTPTPVPALKISYQAYDATKLGLSFEGPAGWTVVDEASDTFFIQNPDSKMDYRATLTLRAEKVSGTYSTAELKTVVKSMLDAIESYGFESYSPSNTDTRELLGKTGVYANYSGVLVLENGNKTSISGRVHAVYVDGVLYTLHLTTPKAQWEDYKNQVYDHLRDTITITK